MTDLPVKAVSAYDELAFWGRPEAETLSKHPGLEPEDLTAAREDAIFTLNPEPTTRSQAARCCQRAHFVMWSIIFGGAETRPSHAGTQTRFSFIIGEKTWIQYGGILEPVTLETSSRIYLSDLTVDAVPEGAGACIRCSLSIASRDTAGRVRC